MHFNIVLDGKSYSLQSEDVLLTEQANKIHIGIGFSHFYDLYCSKTITSRHTPEEVSAVVKISLETFVAALRTIHFEPIFVMNGIVDYYVSFGFSMLLNTVHLLLDKMKVRYFIAPAYSSAQLSFLLKSGCINAILSNSYVSLSDVPSWLHYIDPVTLQAKILHASREVIEQISTISSARHRIFSPFATDTSISWPKSAPPISDTMCYPNQHVPSLIASGVMQAPCVPRPLTGPAFISDLPKNCTAYLNKMGGLYLSIFRTFSKFPMTAMKTHSDDLPFDEFLPLMIQQNQSKSTLPINSRLFFGILSAQNLVSRSFTTLFETLKSISVNSTVDKSAEDTDLTISVLNESVRRFLTAHEYIAPGGGLSPWGRSVLVAAADQDAPTLMFIELIRSDAMDADVGVTDIIERVFSLYPIRSHILDHNLKSQLAGFTSVTRMVHRSLRGLLDLLICDTYLSAIEVPDVRQLAEIVSQNPLGEFKEYPTGTLMRFLLVADSEDRRAFYSLYEGDALRDLKNDILAAYQWWDRMSRATREMKQRSLRPNSRVSNLKNFLMIFECADEFIKERKKKIFPKID